LEFAVFYSRRARKQPLSFGRRWKLGVNFFDLFCLLACFLGGSIIWEISHPGWALGYSEKKTVM
jgi:hypothetical protein